MSLDGGLIAALDRRQKVLERESVSYDYEKVFWNSTWSIGIIGLGALSLKLGFILRDMQRLVEDSGAIVADILSPGSIGLESYKTYYLWIDGDYKDRNSVLASAFARPYIDAWREDPDTVMGTNDGDTTWTIVKAYYAESSDEVDETGKPIVEKGLLDMVDSVFNRVGPLLPVCAVGFHVVREKIRARRMESELKDE